MKIYIAGPMRGNVLFNFPAFDRVRDYLASIGHEPVSPADMDRADGLDPLTLPVDLVPEHWDQRKLPVGWTAKALLERDLVELKKCEAIYLLDGWYASEGAKIEHRVACENGLVIFDETPLHKMPHGKKKTHDTILDEAKALVTGDRNAAYGPPNQDFQRTASMWTGLLQFKLKDGEVIRAQDVAWMMILLKASRAQHCKKKDNYIDTAGYAYCGWRCEEAEDV